MAKHRLHAAFTSFLDTVEFLDGMSLDIVEPDLVEVFYNKEGITMVVRVNGVDVLTISRPKHFEKVDYNEKSRSRKRSH